MISRTKPITHSGRKPTNSELHDDSQAATPRVPNWNISTRAAAPSPSSSTPGGRGSSPPGPSERKAERLAGAGLSPAGTFEATAATGWGGNESGNRTTGERQNNRCSRSIQGFSIYERVARVVRRRGAALDVIADFDLGHHVRVPKIECVEPLANLLGVGASDPLLSFEQRWPRQLGRQIESKLEQRGISHRQPSRNVRRQTLRNRQLLIGG
jgi:hypothetical protein